ncbi:putative mitochondrial hypothetical protein [Leptomonas pyrrhocoris]|uniref:EF-hand domain-containing protein n=1 Tax=Leptomonas pyrrhocoris TaxID=157538 RepID=A0A0M9FVW0_LEPPY|nr:putative mitochondrial hypothetical protein [Leptomonas pyrrhocoris]XP_015655469.1 putative mitochondrial hypothetical protein [Leptomonas pyrrhocoris]KPA77029.1 putative mitochondrial hypothetical protein [Leptomonas pyrrhocoris]KPA77030.1 putative mitochondrial hypothetical protein [Leptomonas pyrrhocoris]|eukprot:XP_015655468.1 putative mitochondrial hypothetical protein [Leptomonas pyrrhocoris]
MATSLPSLDAVVRKVRAQATKRRIALQPFFADFDRLHSGRITAAQFARVLTSNDMQLSGEEIEVLVAAFTPDTPAAAMDATAAASAELKENPPVMYNSFLEALQAAPGSVVAFRRSNASAALTAAEQARLAPVSLMLQRAIQAHGTSLTGPFRDLDPLRTGRVTAAQFRRCLPFSSSVSEDAMGLFAKQYSDGAGGVYYMPWCRSMDPSLKEKDEATPDRTNAMTETAKTRSATLAGSHAAFFQSTTSGLSHDSFANPDLTAEELISIFQQQCALYRVRYEDALRDMDKMKTGRVTAAQFESALGRMPLVHFALRDENVATLARYYSNGYIGPLESCMVDYRSFLRDIHPSQATQTAADGREVQTNFFATAHAPDTYLTSTDDRDKAEALLSKLQANIRANRIHLSPVLRDFDRVRKGIYEHRTCTHTRFARGLATQNILLPPEELQLLIRKYTVPNPDGTPSSEVNYYVFVQDVDPSQVNGGAVQPAVTAPHLTGQRASSTNTNGSSNNGAAVTKEEAVRRVAQQVMSRRLSLATFLEEADPMRSGTVLSGRLGGVLDQAGVQLTAQELAALETAFASTRVAGAVDSAQLQSEVKAMVVVLQSEKQQQQQSGLNGGPATRMESVSPEVQRLLARVQHNVRVHNALLMPFFNDFDRNHRGVITPQQFAQACVRHHLPLSEPELKLVAAAYQTDAAHADEVHYLAFIRDVGCGEESASSGAAETATTVTATRTSPAASLAAGAVQTLSGTAAAAGAASEEAAADVDDLLTKICLFLQERRPRVSEFFPDGDELRHHHVTPTRFRHCLSMLGMTSLTEQELCTLEGGFPSAKCPGEIDYPAFVCTLRAMLADGVGIAAVTQRRLGSGRSALGTNTASASSAASVFGQTTLKRVQHMLRARRTATITAFREYDRARKGFVTDGQFFACLKALGVALRPDEASALLQLYSVGGGQVHYLPFAQEVDDAALVPVS